MIFAMLDVKRSTRKDSAIKFMPFKQNQVLQTVLLVALVLALWWLKFVVLIVFLAFLLATVFHPIVVGLKKRHMPTALAIILPLLLFIGLIGLMLYLLLPPFLRQVADFAHQIPGYINGAANRLHLSVNTGGLQSFITGHSGSIGNVAISATATVVKIITAALSIFVLSVYWLSSYDRVKNELLSYSRGSTRRRLEDIWRRIELKLWSWLRAHVILNTVVGAMVFISLYVLGVPFAGLMAFIAFLVEIIPTAGPIIAALPAIALGLSESLVKGAIVTAVYIIIQQIENHILAPLLLGRTVQLHPIVIIVSLLLGFEIYGIIGAFIAVPVALCVSAAVDSFKDDKAVNYVKAK